MPKFSIVFFLIMPKFSITIFCKMPKFSINKHLKTGQGEANQGHVAVGLALLLPVFSMSAAYESFLLGDIRAVIYATPSDGGGGVEYTIRLNAA